MRGRFSRIAFAFWAALAGEALGQQQGAAPPTPAQLAERLVQLKSGRELPYRLVANWPTLPKGYNLGEGTGVDIDRQGNVWVANRGAWPIVEFDKAGKMLQAWNHDTVRVTPGVGLGTHGLKVDPEGNVWLVDVDGHILFKYSPEGRLLMTLGNRQGAAGNNDSPTSFNRPTNLWFLPNGHFYVSDGYVNSRVVEFTHSIAVDAEGSIYVAEIKNWRIQKWARTTTTSTR